VYEIVDTEFLEFENDRSEIASQNFGVSLFFELKVQQRNESDQLDTELRKDVNSPP
jgi:hypothetical protein